MEKSELGISGSFVDSKTERKRCATHPYCSPGGCGFYMGHEHGWTPETSKFLATQFGFNEKLEPVHLKIFEDHSFIESETTRRLRENEVWKPK